MSCGLQHGRVICNASLFCFFLFFVWSGRATNGRPCDARYLLRQKEYTTVVAQTQCVANPVGVPITRGTGKPLTCVQLRPSPG